MREREENDTLYVSLDEIVLNYQPKTELSMELVNSYIDKFLLEEGDTVITGSLKEWLLFLGQIIDKYVEHEK